MQLKILQVTKKKDSHMTVVTVFFNYKLIIKNDFVFYQPILFTAFVKRETFLAQLFLW